VRDQFETIIQRLEMLSQKNSRVSLSQAELDEVDRLQRMIEDRDHEVATMM